MKGFVADIEKLAEENTNFRQVLYTGAHMQLVLMTIAPGDDIGLETHHDNDQLFQFEGGEGKVVIDDNEYEVEDDSIVIVPAGAQHNIINLSQTDPLQLYTIYSPPHHLDGIVRATKSDAVADAPEFNGITTE